MGPVLIQLGQVHSEQEPFHLQPVGHDKCCHAVISSLLPLLPMKTGFSLPQGPGSAVLTLLLQPSTGRRLRQVQQRHLAAAGMVELKAITACLVPCEAGTIFNALHSPPGMTQAWSEPSGNKEQQITPFYQHSQLTWP